MHVTRKSGRWLPVRIDDVEKWQASLLEESARRLGAVLAPSGRVHRWGFVGSPVTFRGQPAWLRVSPFLEHEMSRKAWRGTAEAAAIPGVSKPALLHRIEWHADAPSPIPVSAEVLTLVTDPLASRERFLRTNPDLPSEWFRDLAESLAALRVWWPPAGDCSTVLLTSCPRGTRRDAGRKLLGHLPPCWRHGRCFLTGIRGRSQPVWRRFASAVWRRPAPGVRTAAASARREPARTTSFFARVMPV